MKVATGTANDSFLACRSSFKVFLIGHAPLICGERESKAALDSRSPPVNSAQNF